MTHLPFNLDSSIVMCEGCSEPTEFDELYLDHSICLTCLSETVLTYYCEVPECKYSKFIATGIQARCPAGHFDIKAEQEDIQSLVDKVKLKEVAAMQAKPMQTLKFIYSKGII